MTIRDAALDMEPLEQELSHTSQKCLKRSSAMNVKIICKKQGIKHKGRIRRRPAMTGELAQDTGLTTEDGDGACYEVYS